MINWLNLALWLLPVTLGSYALGAVVPFALTFLAGKGQLPPGEREETARLLGYLFAFAGALSGCGVALAALLSAEPLRVAVPQALPFGAMSLEADMLSAFFLGVISLLAAVVSVYSIGYTLHGASPRRSAALASLYNLFLLAMTLVVLASHAVLFLIAWEGMSLATYFLINLEHENPASRRGAFLYVVMTHAGTALILAAFLALFAAAGSLDFGAFAAAGRSLSPLLRSAVFLAAFAGFGVKAGIIPLHIWLPEAHPAAPTNVSALMSGVMIKTGIYGIVRVVFSFLGTGGIPGWWGLLVLLVAVSSSVLGVLYALTEHDLKRLLAFHSIENIGIILIGVGGAILFASFGARGLAAVALIAALFHVLNHALFKGLLFLGAGSVLNAAGTKNIEELGGLIHRLPWTALFFLVGAVAISGLPPLNGFMSEWLTFQSLLLGFHLPDLAVKIALPLAVAFLALTGALAAACFVKAFGIAFLGIPRSGGAATAVESPASMLAAMGALALLCVVLGVIPSLALGVLNPLAASLLGPGAQGVEVAAGGAVALAGSSSSAVAPLPLAIALCAGVVLPILFGAMLGGRLRRREAMTWACGLERLEPRMQYTATGFSKPIRLIFSSIYRATHEIGISEDASPYFHPSIRYELRTESVFLRYLYEPLYRALTHSARFLRRLQTGRLQTYLAYIFITLVILLLLAR